MPALSKPNARDTRGADTTNEGFAACETCFDTQQVSPPTNMYAIEHQQESILTRTVNTHTHSPTQTRTNISIHTNTNIQQCVLKNSHTRTLLSTILSAKTLGEGIL